ncbi:Protein RADIALIS-like 1 [Acorus calamus]|uniref:Protein RADIALIS-like 1 n=1 Tax=Acorus calamus TaxID=4465 RepID=A0AAV9CS09_ACOCL|nr:Protein RADIALIS-like 1 [Acorus calamus]
MMGNESSENGCSGWSWKDNKLFEVALAIVDEDDPERWKVVATMIGGKSAEEVEKHYCLLVEDLECIESGELDYRLGDGWIWLPVEQGHSDFWTDEDQKLFSQMNLN